MLAIDSYPDLVAGAFMTVFPRPLAELPSPAWLIDLLRPDAQTPFQADDMLRTTIRDLLRAAGYKPTGRGKPASEYLVKAAHAGTLQSINLAVDACNVTSLHSGLPISVVDTDKVRAPLRVQVAPPGSHYVFNASGQTMELGGLLCLADTDGPCANPVKDAQRSKTDSGTTKTLSVVWGSERLGDRTAHVVAWYRTLLERGGARTTYP